MVNAAVFEKLVDGIVNGLSQKHFSMGDGLGYDEGSGDESDGEYLVRAFYYDRDTDLQHTIMINVKVEVESVECEGIGDDDEDEEDE
jgi:hypothetical protein